MRGRECSSQISHWRACSPVTDRPRGTAGEAGSERVTPAHALVKANMAVAGKEFPMKAYGKTFWFNLPISLACPRYTSQNLRELDGSVSL